jgi:hypothetical protein
MSKSRKGHGAAEAWTLLVGMGITTVTFNIYHYTHTGHSPLFLSLFKGVAPVFAASMLSHIVAAHDDSRVMRAVSFAVMAGAMWLSISAVAAVAGGRMGWLFGAVVDTAVLSSQRVILTRHRAAVAQAAADVPVVAAVDVSAGMPGGMPPEGPLDRVPDDEPGDYANVRLGVPPGGFPEADVPVPDAIGGSPVASGSGTVAPEPEDSPDDEPGNEPDGERELHHRARERYRRSKREAARNGSPVISDRRLGDEFGRSRTWGKNRMIEVDGGPQSVGTAAH